MKDYYIATVCKGAFNSESAVEMWNRHACEPKIVLELLFPISDMNFSVKMLIL